MDAAFLNELEAAEANVAAITTSYSQKIIAMAGEMRGKLSTVLKERQALCEKIEDFWPSRFNDPDGPMLTLMNGTTDSRITRSITHFNIETEVSEAGIIRKVILKFKPNIALASTELFCQFDQDLKIIATSGIEWKAGTEKSQKDSFFRFFSKDFSVDEKTRTYFEDLVVAFEELYQDPFNDELDGDDEEDDDFDSQSDYSSEGAH
eukprot:GDKK01024096.1.p1 GENE.GDKK01024096.1~~GDKK01024096.1.p1  ORF type:complete len:217 (-),score=44.39 GDKK01024096.1:70-687(-)